MRDADSSLITGLSASYLLGLPGSIGLHSPIIFSPTQIIVTAKRNTDFRSVPKGLFCCCWEPLVHVMTNEEVENKRVDDNFGELGSTKSDGKLTKGKCLRKNK